MAQAEPMHTTGAEALLVRLELIQGPCNGTGENEPSFKIVRTVTSGYTPRCYNWGLFREGRFSQPPSCQNFTPVVNTTLLGGGVKASLSTAHGLPPLCVRSPLASGCRRIGRTIPTAKALNVLNGRYIGLVSKPNGDRVISCPFPSTY